MAQCVWTVWRIKTRSQLDELIALFGLVLWLIPLSLSAVSEYRAAALLLPCVVLTTRWPTFTRALVLALSIWIAYELSARVLLGRLI